MTPKDLWFLGIFQSAEPGAESLACFYAFSRTAGVVVFARLGRLAGV